MKKFNSEYFAERLLIKQRVYALSVRKAAKEIGISAASLSRLNNSKFIPDINTFNSCCDWMGLPMGIFFIKQMPNELNK